MKSILFLLAVPLLAQQDVILYSVERERALGQQYASGIRRQAKPLANSTIEGYVKRIGAELIAQLRQSPFEYQFEVIADGDWTEPIPVPGGYILTPVRSLVPARDEAEFVGMLAHSAAHVALRHGTRTANRAQIVSMASMPLVFIGGWTGSHAEAQRAQTLAPLSFLEVQRTCELEADRFGTRRPLLGPHQRRCPGRSRLSCRADQAWRPYRQVAVGLS